MLLKISLGAILLAVSNDTEAVSQSSEELSSRLCES